MGKSLTQDKVCILLFCALMWTFTAAEQLFFPLSSSVTWDEGRSHCQVCFKDLVTLTPGNIQIVARNLSSDYWVGLRKNITSIGNFSVFYRYWANGDPLTFQNWLPGHPLFKSRLPKMDCCSCSCTCPAKPTMSSFTTRYTPRYTQTSVNSTTAYRSQTNGSQNGTNVTAPQPHTTPVTTAAPPIAAECERTPVEVPEDDFEPDNNYIEDACVVMLSFGAWIEKNCSELLPYICYDDVFYGKAQVTNITSTSAAVTWEKGPGDITHYRLEVRTGNQQTGQRSSASTGAALGYVITNLTTTDLSDQLHNLTSGLHYAVQVFAVKCGRDLNPQNATFYTIPHRVKNLKVSLVMDTSITLSWEKPKGNVDLYRIESENLTTSQDVDKEEAEVCNLVPGIPYTFSVSSGVKDKSKWSKKEFVSTYTKPHKVFNLTISENDDDSMKLTWGVLLGNVSGFNITVSWNDKVNRSFYLDQHVRQHEEENLPSGTRITFSVRALTNNNTLEGEESTVAAYTAPQRASNLTLSTTATTLTATWTILEGNDFSFEVKLWLNGELVKTKENISNTSQFFDGLKSAANYTVYVYSVSGHHRSAGVKESKFTLPEKPVNVRMKTATKNHIIFEWDPPENAGMPEYHVRLTSTFWGQRWRHSVDDKTDFTFGDLTSGTRYKFEVWAKAGDLESEIVSLSSYTDTDESSVSLTMMCSSETPLLCDQDGTRNSVFHQLELHFRSLLGNHVIWELKKSL